MSAEIDRYLKQGFTRTEAFVLICLERGAQSVVVNSDDPAPHNEEMRMQVMSLQAQVGMLTKTAQAMKAALVPQYLTEDDVDQLVKRAMV